MPGSDGRSETSDAPIDRDFMSKLFRKTVARADTLLGAVGIFLVAGFGVALLGTLVFAELAEHVTSGTTQALDERVLLWMASHRNPLTDGAMLELTALGTASVVLTIAGIAALFLALNKHQYSALLLGVATAGGLALNIALKIGFHRPRPEIVVHAAQTFSSSFPSGHAMSAAIVYGTVAYLAARLQKNLWSKLLTLLLAFMLILLICISRMYLGVHYPSDVAAGVLVGLAWAGFCMGTLEGIQQLAKRGNPEARKHESPAPEA